MAKQQSYKRSWKNYLLDANYQLRFTLTMLIVAAGLMAPLGYWVSEKASRATEVALNQIDGIRCPAEVVVAPPGAPGAKADDGLVEEDLLDEGAMVPDEEVEPAPEGAEAGEPAPEGAEAAPADDAPAEAPSDETAKSPAEEVMPADGEAPPESADDRADHVRPEIKVNIDDSRMPEPVVVVGAIEMAPPSAAEIEHMHTLRKQCLAHIVNEKAAIRARKDLIRTVMLVSGIFLLMGLGVYGIKTTHRVAGPLFKVGLYLAKLERNVYDTVYNLRKGDQLVEFYNHFKDAHEGVTKMQQEDRDRLRDAIALSRDAGLAAKDAKLAALVAELEALLDETEKSLGQE